MLISYHSFPRCVATVSGDAFVAYYSGFMPGIIALLREATGSDQTVLRGKAMECAGLIGEAVGVQVFANDAAQIMQLFMHALVSIALSANIFQQLTFLFFCALFADTGHGKRHHI